MTKNIFLKLIFFIFFLFSATTMNAQDHTPAHNHLTAHQKSIVSIAALTAFGNLDSLKQHLRAGLDAGLSINEIKEVLVQLYAYCGFPRSLNGINTFRSILEERKAKGINDVVGNEIIQHSDSGDAYEQGRKVLEILTGTRQHKPAPGFGEFAPRIDAFLKEHLFGDIFNSDVLTYQQREFTTIAALAAMAGVEPQLQSHIAMGKNTGITEEQLIETADLIEKVISRTQANTLRKLLAKPELPVIEQGMMVRISEIEIDPAFLKEYNTILKEEAAASVKIEPGVIAIFPMYQSDHPTQVRIIEIYANRTAYQSHLKTPHFQHYKKTTLKMVKSLKLVDMQTLDKETMLEIFKKLN